MTKQARTRKRPPGPRPTLDSLRIYPSAHEVDKAGDEWLIAFPIRCPCGFDPKGSRRERCYATAEHLDQQGAIRLEHVKAAREARRR